MPPIGPLMIEHRLIERVIALMKMAKPGAREVCADGAPTWEDGENAL